VFQRWFRDVALLLLNPLRFKPIGLHDNLILMSSRGWPPNPKGGWNFVQSTWGEIGLHSIVGVKRPKFHTFAVRTSTWLTCGTTAPNMQFLWFGVPPLWLKSHGPKGRLAKWSKGTPYLLFYYFKKNLFNFWWEAFEKVRFKRLLNCPFHLQILAWLVWNLYLARVLWGGKLTAHYLCWDPWSPVVRMLYGDSMA